MPKLRVPPSEKQNRILTANIVRGMELCQVDHVTLARSSRMSVPTWYRRMKNPGEFKLEELRAIAQKLKTTVEMLMSP